MKSKNKFPQGRPRLAQLPVVLLSWLVLGWTAPLQAEEPIQCVEQKPQDFLIWDKVQKDRVHLREAIEYRVKHYGLPKGAPFDASYRKINPEPVDKQLKAITFFGRPAKVHRKIAPLLGCVEKEIKNTCVADDELYFPGVISAFRTKVTFPAFVSNHRFGVAVDFDPMLNPCCGCVGKWKEHPACSKPVDSPFERTQIPPCWVTQFERYGFYWLGWAQMQDTMHFEFLGEPPADPVTTAEAPHGDGKAAQTP